MALNKLKKPHINHTKVVGVAVSVAIINTTPTLNP